MFVVFSKCGFAREITLIIYLLLHLVVVVYFDRYFYIPGSSSRHPRLVLIQKPLQSRTYFVFGQEIKIIRFINFRVSAMFIVLSVIISILFGIFLELGASNLMTKAR